MNFLVDTHCFIWMLFDDDNLSEKAKNVLAHFDSSQCKHKDPFDRFIIWQAIKRDMILISKDKKFKDYEEFGLKSLW